MNGFNTLFSDRIVKQSIIASVVVLIVTFIIALIFYRNLPPFIPVFNQLPWGEDRLGDKVSFFIPLGVAFGMVVGNVLFSRALYTKMPLVIRMISITTFFISFITLIFVIRTIQLLI